MNTLILLAAAAGSPALEPVVVTATRTENPAAEVLASVELIGGDDLLRRPAADLGDALRFVPGIEVARLGGPGQQTSLFVRGTESNHVLVLDGRPAHQSRHDRHAPRIQNIAPDFVERVEVVKGPRSTLYGSDAIGGVINIITRAARARRQRAGGLRQLRHAHRELLPPASATSRPRDASIGVSWIDSDGLPDPRRRRRRPRLREHFVHGLRARRRRRGRAGLSRLARLGHVRVLGFLRARPWTRTSRIHARL